MSSFRRKVSPSTSVARQSDSLHDSTIADSSTPSNQPSMGFKPSVYNSLGIVSSGHAQLDEILGGGMQCGTTMLLGTDIHSNFADTLMAYGLAEALSMRQHCLILTQDPVETRALIDSLAYNRTLGTDAPGSKSHFGCSYDLSRRLQPNIISWQGLSYYTYERPTSAHSLTQPSLADVTAAYVNAVVNFVRSLQGSVGRIFLHGLHHVLSTGGQDMTAAALRRSAEKLILSLRAAVRSTRITLTISALPEALPGSSGVAITLASNSTDGGISATSPLTPYIALVDTALTVDTFAGRNSLVPYEFKDFCGFLVVERIQHFGTLVGHRPIALRYGLKRDRRKLHVDRLHLPPEESRAQGTVETLSTTTTQVTAQSVSVIPVAKEAPPSDIDLKGDMTATQVALGATAGGDKPAIRPYRKLNLGQSHAPAGGISISTFRKPTSVSSSSSSSIGCGPTPGKDSLLEF